MDGNLTCAEAATAGFKGAGHLEDAVTAAPDPEPVSDDLGCSDDDPSAPAPPACRAADTLVGRSAHKAWKSGGCLKDGVSINILGVVLLEAEQTIVAALVSE